MRIGERSHAAATTSAGRLGDGTLLALEGLAFVSRAGDEYGASGFAIGVAGLRRVPGNVDIAVLVRCDGTAAVQAIGVGDDGALRLECGAGVVQARVEKRSRRIGDI